MVNIVKTVQQIGNGAHIYLPKDMVGQKVIITSVEKNISEIEREIFQIMEPYLKNIMGIYLYGSYARGDQTPESDIDVLVITDGKPKIKKRINEYEIISLSLEQIDKTIKYAAVLLLPLLKEAKTILNSELIKKYKNQIFTKKNTKWYLDTTNSALQINKDWIEEEDINNLPAIVYSLIMRLKGLYLIESMATHKKYSNDKIIYFLIKNGIHPDKIKEIYRLYRDHRDGKIISPHTLQSSDVKALYRIIYKYFIKIRSLWVKLI